MDATFTVSSPGHHSVWNHKQFNCLFSVLVRLITRQNVTPHYRPFVRETTGKWCIPYPHSGSVMRKTFPCGQGVIIKVVFSMCGRHSMAIEYSRKTDNLLVSLSLKGSHVRMLTFSYRSCAVCTIVSYITAIYRESIALAYSKQHNHAKSMIGLYLFIRPML